jgi:hypothetical protein
MNDSNQANNSNQKVEVLYRIFVDDIMFIKQQMWRMIYYCSVLFAVIFYLADYCGKKGKLEDLLFQLPYNISVSINHVLAIFSGIVAYIGLQFLYNFNCHLRAEREGQANITYWYFDVWFKYMVCLPSEKLKPEEILEKLVKGCHLWKDKFFLIIFMLIILGALGIVLFHIYCSFPQAVCPYERVIGVIT